MAQTIRHGVYFGFRRERSWFRAMIYVYDHGRRMWQETKGLPLTCRADAIERAEWEANSFADTHSPRPTVQPL